ncbi:unnamed protein product [Ectocarpus sp. 4 AP-2014]
MGAPEHQTTLHQPPYYCWEHHNGLLTAVSLPLGKSPKIRCGWGASAAASSLRGICASALKCSV